MSIHGTNNFHFGNLYGMILCFFLEDTKSAEIASNQGKGGEMVVLYVLVHAYSAERDPLSNRIAKTNKQKTIMPRNWKTLNDMVRHTWMDEYVFAFHVCACQL